ncbi:MAG TPA: XdhC family protein [Candidatus Eremiobacteraceae bacterium]
MHYFDRPAELEQARATFAVATVVARRSPVSSHLGDRAVVHADGRMEGFVGGSCSRDLVRREALRAIQTGKPRLLQIRPDNDSDEHPDSADGERVTVPMGCASNGAVDVYIEPHVPPGLLLVVGYTPVAEALARIAAAAQQFDVVRVAIDAELRDLETISGVRVLALGALEPFLAALDPAARSRLVAIIASQGHYDEAALETLLAGPAAFVGLLASRRRAAAIRGVLAQSGTGAEAIARIRNPVGMDIGARSATEVAISILAEIVSESSKRAARAPEQTDFGSYAADPICGMDVDVRSARFAAEHRANTIFFCSAGCRAAFLADPEKYAIASTSLP